VLNCDGWPFPVVIHKDVVLGTLLAYFV